MAAATATCDALLCTRFLPCDKLVSGFMFLKDICEGNRPVFPFCGVFICLELLVLTFRVFFCGADGADAGTANGVCFLDIANICVLKVDSTFRLLGVTKSYAVWNQLKFSTSSFSVRVYSFDKSKKRGMSYSQRRSS